MIDIVCQVVPKFYITCDYISIFQVFVTHGGLLGTMEGVYCGVPMIGVPMFGDQLSNIKNYVRRGIALMVNVQEIEEKFEKSLNEVLTDKKFKETALK